MHEVGGMKSWASVSSQFVHAEVVRALEVPPHKIVGARPGDDIDVMGVSKCVDQKRGVVERNQRGSGVEGAEPGER
jgi:hypothetical protein